MLSRLAAVVTVIVLCLSSYPALAQEDQGALSKPDQLFVTNAAQDGMGQLRLGELAVEKAANGAVKTFAQSMIDDHGKSNEELAALATKKEVSLPTDIGKHQKTWDKLNKLEGAAFDKAYVRAMVQEHKEDVKAFQKQAANGKDSEVKAWAASTLPKLEQHLATVTELNKTMNAEKSGGGPTAGGRGKGGGK